MLHRSGKLKGAPVDKYASGCEQIKQQLKQRGWNSRLQTYVSVLDGTDLDASLLLLSWYGFEKANSSRMRHTYHAILEKLGTTHGLLYRYETPVTEGTFALCSFWEAEFLALGGGSLARAHALFKRLLAYRNDLGLYAEEIEPRTGDALGNFPQAFTHIGLIGAALSICQREKGEKQLTHRPDEPEISHESVAA
jgi:GH15 family glucan-1,4-alpha-glucosidase